MSNKTTDVEPPGLIGPGHSLASVTDKIADMVLTKRTPLGWWFAVLVTGTFVGILGFTIVNVFFRGIGLWGPNNPVGWGFDIINFVWWIGIGHAGTLISAILLLLRQGWRTSINRAAEAMTIFAVMCAGMYPLMHTGRPWLAFWMLPLPNSMGMWQNFRSPLIWDVFAVSTYATVSLVFWYVGMIPDLATLRDRAKNIWVKRAYGALALGWRNAASHWDRYEMASLLLAGISTPLVVSVHTVVSFDFAAGIIPGWHTTIFPPYFVAGAIFAGFAMVLTLMLPIRAWYRLEDFITERHLQNMGKVMLATGLIVAYGYAIEAFTAWYSGSPYESYMIINRLTGPYKYEYWSLMLCNILIPQVLWSRKARSNVWVLFWVSMAINVGMWLERFVIIVMSLHRDFLPSSWGMYHPTRYDWGMFLGTIGFFTFAFTLFIRFLPAIAMFEMRGLVPPGPARPGKSARGTH
jgi:molybdopterin-containing oxidoreductase family membrane subunit